MIADRNEVLTIFIHIISIDEIKGDHGNVVMIAFDGYSDCENFKGKIEKNGVDTQISYQGMPQMLSARYLLKGKDIKGNNCSIFIENNAIVKENEPLKTNPKIITDSKELSWLETANLSGEIENSTDGLIIHIFEE
jgi:hypothetical protein